MFIADLRYPILDSVLLSFLALQCSHFLCRKSCVHFLYKKFFSCLWIRECFSVQSCFISVHLLVLINGLIFLQTEYINSTAEEIEETCKSFALLNRGLDYHCLVSSGEPFHLCWQLRFPECNNGPWRTQCSYTFINLLLGPTVTPFLTPSRFVAILHFHLNPFGSFTCSFLLPLGSHCHKEGENVKYFHI